MRLIKHPCRHLETNPVLLPRQPTPTKIPAEFVENSVNMNSSTEERVPGIVHFADFVFWGYCAAEFYHGERNHQGLDNQLIESSDEVGCTTGEISCRERLGGMLRYYYRRAA